MALDLDGMQEIVCQLTSSDLRKSMTTFVDHLVWQDVYHAKLRMALLSTLNS